MSEPEDKIAAEVQDEDLLRFLQTRKKIREHERELKNLREEAAVLKGLPIVKTYLKASKRLRSQKKVETDTGEPPDEENEESDGGHTGEEEGKEEPMEVAEVEQEEPRSEAQALRDVASEAVIPRKALAKKTKRASEVRSLVARKEAPSPKKKKQK
jgi:hypothetical protein